MGNYAVECASCGLRWQRPGSLSAHEGQSVESRPCPKCGAYTLGCAEVRPVVRKFRARPALGRVAA
ncbi:hypothetical protein J0H58_20530 [bacterium]|nr:hypothetical protein [bacterium]